MEVIKKWVIFRLFCNLLGLWGYKRGMRRRNFSDLELRMIGVMYMYKFSRREIAEKFGSTVYTINNIIGNKAGRYLNRKGR